MRKFFDQFFCEKCAKRKGRENIGKYCNFTEENGIRYKEKKGLTRADSDIRLSLYDEFINNYQQMVFSDKIPKRPQ